MNSVIRFATSKFSLWSTGCFSNVIVWLNVKYCPISWLRFILDCSSGRTEKSTSNFRWGFGTLTSVSQPNPMTHRANCTLHTWYTHIWQWWWVQFFTMIKFHISVLLWGVFHCCCPSSPGDHAEHRPLAGHPPKGGCHPRLQPFRGNQRHTPPALHLLFEAALRLQTLSTDGAFSQIWARVLKKKEEKASHRLTWLICPEINADLALYVDIRSAGDPVLWLRQCSGAPRAVAWTPLLVGQRTHCRWSRPLPGVQKSTGAPR